MPFLQTKLLKFDTKFKESGISSSTIFQSYLDGIGKSFHTFEHGSSSINTKFNFLGHTTNSANRRAWFAHCLGGESPGLLECRSHHGRLRKYYCTCAVRAFIVIEIMESKKNENGNERRSRMGWAAEAVVIRRACFARHFSRKQMGDVSAVWKNMCSGGF